MTQNMTPPIQLFIPIPRIAGIIARIFKSLKLFYSSPGFSEKKITFSRCFQEENKLLTIYMGISP
jgi:hypothetical protein